MSRSSIGRSPRWTSSAPSSPSAAAGSMPPLSSRTPTSIGGPSPPSRTDHPELLSFRKLQIDAAPRRRQRQDFCLAPTESPRQRRDLAQAPPRLHAKLGAEKGGRVEGDLPGSAAGDAPTADPRI